MLYSHPEAPPLPCATPPERPPSRPRPRPQPRTHGHEPAAHQALRPPGLEDTGRAQVGAGRRRARRQRRFVTRTYLSPILLSSTPRRMGERYVHVGKVRSRSGPLHAGARTWRGDGGIHRRAPAAPRGRPDVPDVEPHRVLHGRLPEGSASGSRRPADSSDRCRRLPPPATPTVPSGSRSVQGNSGRPLPGLNRLPGLSKTPLSKTPKAPRGPTWNHLFRPTHDRDP